MRHRVYTKPYKLSTITYFLQKYWEPSWEDVDSCLPRNRGVLCDRADSPTTAAGRELTGLSSPPLQPFKSQKGIAAEL